MLFALLHGIIPLNGYMLLKNVKLRVHNQLCYRCKCEYVHKHGALIGYNRTLTG